MANSEGLCRREHKVNKGSRRSLLSNEGFCFERATLEVVLVKLERASVLYRA